MRWIALVLTLALVSAGTVARAESIAQQFERELQERGIVRSDDGKLHTPDGYEFTDDGLGWPSDDDIIFTRIKGTGNIEREDVIYELLGNEALMDIRYDGLERRIGNIEGESNIGCYMLGPAGLFTLKGDTEQTILYCTYEDSEWAVYFQKVRPEGRVISPETCVRIDYEPKQGNGIFPAQSITDPARIRAFFQILSDSKLRPYRDINAEGLSSEVCGTLTLHYQNADFVRRCYELKAFSGGWYGFEDGRWLGVAVFDESWLVGAE